MGASSGCQIRAGGGWGSERDGGWICPLFLSLFLSPSFLWMSSSASSYPSFIHEEPGFVTRGWEPRNLAATAWPSSTSLFVDHSLSYFLFISRSLSGFISLSTAFIRPWPLSLSSSSCPAEKVFLFIFGGKQYRKSEKKEIYLWLSETGLWWE